MRTGLILAVSAWILAAVPVFAQSLPVPTPPGPVAAVPDTNSPTSPAQDVDQPFTVPTSGYTIWARGEYLAYWVKSTPVGVSVVTGDPANPTQELLNSDRSLGIFSGVRYSLGVFLDPENLLGVEASGFLLFQRSRNFVAESDASGTPALALPFINVTPGAVGFSQMPIASPGVFAGLVQVGSSLQLWGAEGNATLVLLPRELGGIEITALGGFRYLNLQENLEINTASSDILTVPSTVLMQSDQFSTRNQFYGGQVGGRVSWQGDRLAVDVTGKVALGVTHELVDITGFSAQSGPGGVNGTFPGGFFTQQSNMGRTASNQFGVIPSVELKLRYFLTPQLQLFAGYDFLYWSDVVRPGSQIDHSVNLSQSAVLGSGMLTGPANPAPLFSRTDFWAQGVTFGFELRY